jgi:hypothetical protein
MVRLCPLRAIRLSLGSEAARGRVAGSVAQLGEHLVCNLGVRRSSPSGPPMLSGICGIAGTEIASLPSFVTFFMTEPASKALSVYYTTHPSCAFALPSQTLGGYGERRRRKSRRCQAKT